MKTEKDLKEKAFNMNVDRISKSILCNDDGKRVRIDLEGVDRDDLEGLLLMALKLLQESEMTLARLISVTSIAATGVPPTTEQFADLSNVIGETGTPITEFLTDFFCEGLSFIKSDSGRELFTLTALAIKAGKMLVTEEGDLVPESETIH